MFINRFFLVFVLLFSCSFTSCGRKSHDTTKPPDKKQEEKTAQRNVRIISSDGSWIEVRVDINIPCCDQLELDQTDARVLTEYQGSFSAILASQLMEISHDFPGCQINSPIVLRNKLVSLYDNRDRGIVTLDSGFMVVLECQGGLSS